ncbi:hypothetical protein ACPW7J_01365 [Ihubacter sp. rT4E-8]|uniref:hypothetical protein n=1 Tax=Ihubacter sp. rT4E-8 TaxID=3242369 RepID=UPI003CECE771
MNRRVHSIKYILICFAMCTIFCYGCSTDNQKPRGVVDLQQIDVKFNVGEDETATCTYRDGKDMIFSIGSRNGKPEGPLLNTDRLVLYNIERQTEKVFSLDIGEYVYRAVKVNDGVLYAVYELRDDDRYNWYLRYLEDDGEKTVDSGICGSYDDIPAIQMIGDIPYYLYTDQHEKSDLKYELGVRRFEDNEVETVLAKKKKTNDGMSLFLSNGQEYCFLTGKDFPTVCIGDASGIKHEQKLDMKMIDYGINDDYVICSLGTEDKGKEELALVSINIKTGDLVKSEAKEQYYRTQGSGDVFLCVDWQFTPYRMDVDEDGLVTIAELEYPEAVDLPNSPVLFYPLGNRDYMMCYDRKISSSESVDEYYRFRLE